MIFEALLEIILLITLLMLYYSWRILKKTVLDSYRGKLFSIRTSLYDLAARGEVDPDEVAYRHVEAMINTLIRFAHKTKTLNITISLIIIKLGWYQPEKEMNSDVIEMSDNITNEAKEKLISLRDEALTEVIKFLPKYSPSWLFVIMYIYVRHLINVFNNKTRYNSLVLRWIFSDYSLEEYHQRRNGFSISSFRVFG